jgi:hypothetical protein
VGGKEKDSSFSEEKEAKRLLFLRLALRRTLTGPVGRGGKRVKVFLLLFRKTKEESCLP